MLTSVDKDDKGVILALAPSLVGKVSSFLLVICSISSVGRLNVTAVEVIAAVVVVIVTLLEVVDNNEAPVKVNVVGEKDDNVLAVTAIGITILVVASIGVYFDVSLVVAAAAIVVFDVVLVSTVVAIFDVVVASAVVTVLVSLTVVSDNATFKSIDYICKACRMLSKLHCFMMHAVFYSNIVIEQR